MGIDSAESSHCDDDGTSDDDDDDGAVATARVGVVDGIVAAAGVGVVGGPPVDICFSPIHSKNEEGDEDIDGEVAAASNAGEMIAAVARGEDAARARPQSMLLLNRAGSAVSAAASHGGSGGKSTAPRRSPSLFVVESRRGGGGKTKNSTNRYRVSLSKSIQRVAESLAHNSMGVSTMTTPPSSAQ